MSLASGQITITDFSDAMASPTPPDNPAEGMMWLDTSTTPNKLKQYINGVWVVQKLDLGDIDPGANNDLTEVVGKVTDMGNDSKITKAERIKIKERLRVITGAASFSTTLPTLTQMDNSEIGEVYGVRKECDLFHMSKDNGSRLMYESKYNALKSYLDGLNPKAWDTTSESPISVNASIWQGRWVEYDTAHRELRKAIAAIAQGNVEEAEQLVNRLSTRGLLIKDNFKDMVTAESGTTYFHGYDKKGQPADRHPFLVLNGVTRYLKKGALKPTGTGLSTLPKRGYIVFEKTGQQNETIDDVSVTVFLGNWFLVSADDKGVWKKYNSYASSGHNTTLSWSEDNHFTIGMITNI